MTTPRGVLFLCVANSARSQLGEALARGLFGDEVRVQSAGSRPSQVNPLALEVLREIGVEATGQTSKSVDTIDPATVDTVITLCAEEECPLFLGAAARLHWGMPDPAGGAGSLDEQLDGFRRARDALRVRLAKWRDDGFPR